MDIQTHCRKALLAANFIKTLPKEMVMIHHVPEVQPRGPRGRVNDHLIKCLIAEGWKQGGNIVKKGGIIMGRTIPRLL